MKFICEDVASALTLNVGFVYRLWSVDTCFTRSAHALRVHTTRCNWMYSGNCICYLNECCLNIIMQIIKSGYFIIKKEWTQTKTRTFWTPNLIALQNDISFWPLIYFCQKKPVKCNLQQSLLIGLKCCCCCLRCLLALWGPDPCDTRHAVIVSAFFLKRFWHQSFWRS